MLVVAQDYPWPAVTGSMIRLGAVLTALDQVGDIDLYCFVHPRRADACQPPSGAPVVRATTATYADLPFVPRRRLRWLFSQQPLLMATTDYREPYRRFVAWAQPSYDLVWFSRAHTYESLGRPRLGPTVVDLDDLEDQKILARRDVWREDSPHRHAIRTQAAYLQASLDARRWRYVQQSIAKAVETVTVCSEIDARRLGVPNASVVPNAYLAPDTPAGRAVVGEEPTVLFAGFHLYAPNVDGAQWLVNEVLPHLCRVVPAVRLRLVGESVPAVDRLHDPPTVTVVGRVPEIEPELRRADVVAVPIRFGSGTRIKILEAFAHRIPVVATTLGAEGLRAEHERHLLLADTPTDFAAACARLLRDQPLRARLVDEAERLFWAHHSWPRAQAAVTRVARQYLAPVGTPT